MFWWRASESTHDWAFTDRVGGISDGAYAGLDLALHVGDDPEHVTANRALLAEPLGAPVDRLVFMDQCHGAEVAVVDAPPQVPPRADALVTTAVGLTLVALVADCTPVLLVDPDATVAGAVHAGRPGLAAGIVPAAVAAMRDLGARAITAVVGPSVCSRCYEVPAQMREEVAAVAPAARAVSWTGTPALDVAAGVVEQLQGLGVSTRWIAGCTREEERLYSHRRDGVTGRFAGVVQLR